ncbi:hypothetical protein V6N13_053621 [Hibiscus sabdariffa]
MHGTSRPCLRGTVERATHECCRVGRANYSNAFEHEEIYHQYDDGNGNQKHDRGLHGRGDGIWDDRENSKDNERSARQAGGRSSGQVLVRPTAQ